MDERTHERARAGAKNRETRKHEAEGVSALREECVRVEGRVVVFLIAMTM